MPLWRQERIKMKIKKIIIKHFGKFTDQTFSFDDGINIIYGENESGKSTLHTFIKSMLFGLERGRGRAANNDVFSQYEPWDNPNYYSGMLTFESGGKTFCISRNFDKYSKNATLVCQDDGEELSIEDGDLSLLLDDMSESVYDNTVSIGQLKAEPSKPLAVALKNYATNCYTSGGGDMDQSAAMEFLKKRKKMIQKEIDGELQKKSAMRERLELEASYVWRDIHRFQEELEALQKEIQIKKEKGKQIPEESGSQRKKIQPAVIVLFLLLILIPFRLVSQPWSYLVAIVVFLLLGNYVWSKLKVGKKQVKTESEKILEEISGESETLEKLLWEEEHILAELKEKQIQYDNFQEQMEELEVISDIVYQMEQKKQAISLAEEKISELSAKMQESMKGQLNEKAAQILSEITDQKYTCINIEETLKMSVLSGNKAVDVEQLSRGTLEQIYFAIRMAATEILQKEEQPVILDDTFVYYDDRRLANILKWLSENKRQVLIFTCQKREEETLNNMGIKYKAWHF